ncbi:MAG TPA: retroviral-like aspartic protease family protein [Pyrinomonadaceae bacterium]|jgi:outer membrane lipoprotein-sorting protein
MKTQTGRIFRLACLLALALAPAWSAARQTAAQGPRTAAEALARVRAAVGYERLRAQEGGVAAEGAARVRGVDSTFTFSFAPGGRFRTDVTGPLGAASGFDGAEGWEVDWTGMPQRLELHDLEATQFNAWVFSGRWLDEGGPFAVTLDASKSGAGQVALGLALKGGLLEATAYVDAATWLPKRFTRRTTAGEEVVELSDYREALGFRFPHRVTRAAGGVTNVFETRAVAALPAGAAASRFAPVTARPDDSRWDASRPAVVESRRARSGHMLVRALVNGKDVGWFVLDSGAGGMVIDPRAADRLSLPALGEVVAVGAHGRTKARFRLGDTLAVGPLTVRGTRYMELDLDFLRRAFGVEVGGVCGRDVFMRAVVEVDVTGGTVALHDPARFRLEGAAWQELFFSSRHPAVRARFEGGREALFKLDTGSDRTVSFHGPAVERLGLLAGRETHETHSTGVGGAKASREGRLAWFELAGHRFESPEVEFTGAREGAFSDVYTAGNIGAGFLRQFRVVFDYGDRRIAFAPRGAAKAAGAGSP